LPHVAAHILLLPDDLAQYGRSLTATLLFASNLFFWGETDYFARPAETQPLLHTWSLAVEEQFYLAYPLLLWLIARYRRDY
jgi:peptidoglycan/LPS O-acetylase OafA/YrhL